MRVLLCGLSLSLLAMAATPSWAADPSSLLSVIKPAGQAMEAHSAAPKEPVKAAESASDKEACPKPETKPVAETKASVAKPAASKPATKAPAASSAATTDAPPTESESGAGQTAETTAAPPKPTASQALAQAFDAYRSAQTPESAQVVWNAFHSFVAQSGLKNSSAAIFKAYPILSQLGVRIIDAGPGRVWTISRLPGYHNAVVQWVDAKPVVSFVGRRHKIKKVTYITTSRTQDLVYPPTVLLKDARVLGGAEGTHGLILVGDEKGSSLWLREYRTSEKGWVEHPGRFSSVPSFLVNNVSGRVGFRGSDLLFTVARVVPGKAEGLPGSVPEADSSTYKFWLHATENGYVLQTRMPDEEQFGIVRQFVDNIAGNRTDAAKSLLMDSKLLSIPKYIGLRGSTANFKVIEMASPPNGAFRFRLVTGLQDDLIFDVGRVKDRPIIKAIFIASPDAFLHDIAGQLSAYARMPEPAKPAEAE